MTRILICAGYYFPHIGGYERNIHELAKRLVVRGHEVHVMTTGQGYDVMDGVHVYRLPYWKVGGVAVPKFRSTIPDLNYQVVITETRFFPTSILGLAHALNRHVPLIHVERGSYHSVSESIFGRMAIRMYDHTLGAWLVMSARKNIGVSLAACSFINHIGGRNVSEICNGIDPIPFEHRRRRGERIVIIYVGRLIYAKGVQDLIEAFNECRKDDSRLLLRIIGDGDYRKELEKQAGQDVLFMGEFSHERVMSWLALADIFVNPSYSEGLPTSVMEAASVGLPIIATAVGGTDEIIMDGISGVVIQPHRPDHIVTEIKEFVEDVEWAEELGLGAKKAVEKFNWNKITDQYEKLIREVVG